MTNAELRRVQEAWEAVVEAERGLRAAVASARESGAAWRQVGEVLGVTRQAAHARFADRREPRRR